ncbi:MAG: metal ABC transporter permease [Pirellulaceae bacterium]|nr:metal ABC transporter permease [Pirellulaceae bacterium]
MATAPWWWRALTLSDYNTRVVLCGTILLGVAAGLTGVYLLLRKRALLGDAISHATLPGVALMFLLTIVAGVPKSLALLLVGAAITGAIGGLTVMALRQWLRIGEDAALGTVLSVFFGAGVAITGIVVRLPGGNAAGLESFIYGKAASMTISDAWLSGALAVGVLIVIGLFAKELKILCFDMELAKSQGWPVLALDLMLVGLVVTVTIIGLQAVGLILVIALLIVPAASARFWSYRLGTILAISAAVGGISCGLGTLLSASFEKLPSGATIVLVACAFFLISFLYGSERGFVWQVARTWRLQRQQQQQHLLRSMYELLEADGKLTDSQTSRPSESLAAQTLSMHRGWSRFTVRRVSLQLERMGLLTFRPDMHVQLTPRGLLVARRLVREHRLLERYFIDEIAVSEGDADRGADYLEHSLAPELLWELDGQFGDSETGRVPASPHPLRGVERPTDRDTTGKASDNPSDNVIDNPSVNPGDRP